MKKKSNKDLQQLPRGPILWSLFWVSLAIAATVYIHFTWGTQLAREFFSGYLIEKLLSIDNLFVFLTIFKFFKIPLEQQHRALNLGLLGAVIARGLFILIGIHILEEFHFVIYFLGIFLIGTGLHSMFSKREKEFNFDLERNRALRLFKKYFRIHLSDHSNRLFHGGRQWYLTRLFLVICIVEFTDVIFALDSIPAVLAITSNAWIVYSSNLFAILGLRSLYFLLQDLHDRFENLHYAVSAILMFVGAKMLLSDLVSISTGVSLIIIIALLITVSWGAGRIFGSSRKNPYLQGP